MPALDSGRSRVRLTPDDVVLLADLAAGDPEAQASPRLPVLEQAGLVVDGLPAPEVAELLPVVFDPDAVVDLRTGHRAVLDDGPGERVLRHGVHVRGPVALVVESFPGSDELDIGLVDAALAGAALVRLAGVLPRPAVAVAPVRLPAALLADLVEGLADPTAAAVAVGPLHQVLTARLPHLVPAQVDALAALLTGRRGSWRATTRADRPLDPGRTLTVLDGGTGGLWEQQPEPDPAVSDVVLEPRTSAQVSASLTALLDPLVDRPDTPPPPAPTA